MKLNHLAELQSVPRFAPKKPSSKRDDVKRGYIIKEQTGLKWSVPIVSSVTPIYLPLETSS